MDNLITPEKLRKWINDSKTPEQRTLRKRYAFGYIYDASFQTMAEWSRMHTLNALQGLERRAAVRTTHD